MKKKFSIFIFALFGLLLAAQVDAADVSFSLRYYSNLVFQGQAALPAPGTITLTDMNGVGRTVNAQSVLALLANIDAANPAFAVSKLQYFPGFSPPSLYLKCIQILAEAGEACDNWLYVVNGASPAFGMDQYILQGGEQVYVYFGTNRQVSVNKSPISSTDAFIASAHTYNYQDNTWSPATGVTIGVFTGDYWAPNVVATKAASQTGQEVFQISTPGTYGIGIVEDFYYPSVSFTVLQSEPGGSISPSIPWVQESSPKVFNAEKALEFLKSRQNSNGSFGSSSMFSDWAAVALGSFGGDPSTSSGQAKSRLRAYLAEDPNPGQLLSDSVRRAMALLALGINPYSGTRTNYVEKITRTFDGTQMGDPNLYNDDVFSLLVLLKAGYSLSDEIIHRTTSFVLSYQQENGSWNGVDMTAAAIQALSLVSSQDNVREALIKARAYLQKSQENNGSFGNVYSTTWVMQAIAALAESAESWKKNETTPRQYLTSQQVGDGGVESLSTIDNRVWATSYAIPAAFGKDWGKILVEFRKPQELALAPVLQVEPGTLDPALAKEIQLQLDVVAQETRALTLEVVQFQLAGMSKRIAALESRVLAFEQEEQRALARTQPEPLAQGEQVQEELLVQAGPLPAEQLQAPQLTAAAGARELPVKTLLPYIVTAGILAFLLFGNPMSVVSFVHRRFLFRQL